MVAARHHTPEDHQSKNQAIEDAGVIARPFALPSATQATGEHQDGATFIRELVDRLDGRPVQAIDRMPSLL